MKATALLLCALGLALANPNHENMQKADKQFLQKQHDMMQLFMNLQQPCIDQKVQQQANSFSFQHQMQNSNNQHAVMQMMNAYQQGMLPRGQVWNYNNPNHLQQAIHLFDMFYFAKDYKTFYQAACWARNNMNEGMFVYAMSVAILNRPDTQGIALPPMAEVNPHMYVNAQAVQMAQNYKQQGQKEAYMRSNHTNNYAYNMQHFHHQDPEEYPFNSQYMNMYDNENHANQYQNQQQHYQEGRMSYYNEDIHMNQQFAYEQMKNPAWFHNQKYNQNKHQNQNQNNGENFYYYLQQALARYNLERYANGMPNVHPFHFYQKIQPGYNPQMQYMNGQGMTVRPNNVHPNMAHPHVMQQMMNMDRRISDVVDSHRAMSADGAMVQMNAENGMQMLGNMMQNNGDSVNNNYYGANHGMYGYLDQCRRMVGSIVNYNNYNSNNMPSAIEHDHSANRDPVFYQCVSRVVNYFQNFKNQMKPYNMDQLHFQGVKVQSVHADKLITYFDDAHMNMYNAIQYQQDEQPHQYQYIAQQQRLNYKPFNYQIQVHSDKDTDAIVRVFIGPKYDAQGQQNSLEQARQNFVEIDRFMTHLKNGQNMISRNSQDSTRFVHPQNSTHQMMNNVQQAMQGGQTYYYYPHPAQRQAVFPQNMMLPKGSRQGQEYVLAVAIHSYQGNQQDQHDNRPQGFPFDRVVREAYFKQAQNIHFQTVKVYNKNQTDINTVA